MSINLNTLIGILKYFGEAFINLVDTLTKLTHVAFFFFNIYIYIFLNFIYLFLAVLCLRFRVRAFSSCGKRGPLFITVHRPHYRGLSCCRAQAPDAQAQ